jgi:ABC-type transport system involved in multi-copper enzyme maturation permease subunit
LGKYLGLLLTLLVMLVLMALIFCVLILLQGYPIAGAFFIAILFIFVELCLITAVAMLFSCFSTPILSTLFSLSFYLIGHISWGLETLIDKMPQGIVKTIVRILYLLLPDLENFNFKTEVVHLLPIPPRIFLYSSLYGIFYTVFILALAMMIFRRRDFI